MKQNILFVCVGTDRSTGDSLGPLIGTELKQLGYNVIGTIDDPYHGANMQERIKEIPSDAYVIAIDACLGKLSSVGTFKHQQGSIKPGAGVGKTLPEVGDEHIFGVVNVSGFMEYFVLQNTRLSLIFKMRDEIVTYIKKEWPIYPKFSIEEPIRAARRGRKIVHY